jgi:murein hydrolase activator
MENIRLRIRIAIGILALAFATPALAQEADLQQQLRDSQQRLEQVRRERAALQQQMERLRTRVHTTASELSNIERQVRVSATALEEIEFQSTTLTGRVDEVTGELIRARDRLRERHAVLLRRLRSIYMRGPLNSLEVLLSARTFGDLLNRYKYLHLIALYDRLLVEEIQTLERDLVSRDNELRRSLNELQRLRDEKLQEFAQLQFLETQQERALRDARAQERTTQGRIDQLAQDEARLAGVLEDLERRRIEEERRRTVAGAAPAAANLTTADMGSLAWPVEGQIVYRFGREQRPNGVVLRWNGIGIGAPAGTPVQVVEAGTVMMAGPFEGYGPTVIVSHGGGYYTLYHYLQNVAVREGEAVRAGQVIGRVGGQNTPEGPHIEFQVRAPISGGLPQPVDPLGWLRGRSGR